MPVVLAQSAGAELLMVRSASSFWMSTGELTLPEELVVRLTCTPSIFWMTAWMAVA